MEYLIVVNVVVLFVLLRALLGAPEGYEDENGFHVRARRNKRPVLAISGSRRLARLA